MHDEKAGKGKQPHGGKIDRMERPHTSGEAEEEAAAEEKDGDGEGWLLSRAFWQSESSALRLESQGWLVSSIRGKHSVNTRSASACLASLLRDLATPYMLSSVPLCLSPSSFLRPSKHA